MSEDLITSSSVEVIEEKLVTPIVCITFSSNNIIEVYATLGT